MKNYLLLLIAGILISNVVFSQNASTFFPSNTGYKWYYKNIPLDSNNNPQTNLTTYRIDSFAVVANYQGLNANVVRYKDWLTSLTQNSPYNDTNYFNFQTTNGWQYMKTSMFLDTIPVPGIGSFFKSLEGWYNIFRFAQSVGSQYQIVQKDTTIQFDTIAVPLRVKVLGTRLNDEVVSTVYGNYTAKKFIISYGLYVRILIFELPIVVRPDTTWLAQNVWMVKQDIPFTKIDLSNLGYPIVIPIPGICYELSLPPIGIRNISSEVPEIFNLYQNYPNPFNPETKIKFDISPLSRGVGETRGVFTQLKIYDINGREISTLVNDQLSPGTYEVTFNSGALSSGVYFYKLESGSYSKVLKLTLIK
jgi:hypothetical protein